MNFFRQMQLKLKIAWRARALKRGRQMGMTMEEARTYTNETHPLTPAEAAYEQEMLRRKSEIPN